MACATCGLGTLAEIGELDVMKLYHNRPIGTPGYLAPETARGDGATALSDIYCLGLCLYHALTGQKLLQVSGKIAETVALCANPPRFVPGPELGQVPDACLRILSKCLELEPAQRYQSAQQLANDLRRFVVDISRDDSSSPLPLPGENPFADPVVFQNPRRSIFSFFGRLGRLWNRQTPHQPPRKK